MTQCKSTRRRRIDQYFRINYSHGASGIHNLKHPVRHYHSVSVVSFFHHNLFDHIPGRQRQRRLEHECDFDGSVGSDRCAEALATLTPCLRRAIPARRLSAISTRSRILYDEASNFERPRQEFWTPPKARLHPSSGVFAASIPCYVRLNTE